MELQPGSVTTGRLPLDWAMTQMNLGNALQTLGAREAGDRAAGRGLSPPIATP